MSSNRNDYLERVKAEIRAEAEVARARTPLSRNEVADPAIAPITREDGIERDRLDYAIGELTGSHYNTFVDQAFRALLKRAPDETGSVMQIRLLAAGASKAEVLGNLRWSPEGRRVGTRVRGLLPRYALAKLARVPVLGYFIDWGLALAGLPVLMRHQRATDTSVAARFDSAVDTQRAHDQRLASIDGAIADLGAEGDRRNTDAEAQREHGRRLDDLAAQLAALRADHEGRGNVLTDCLRRINQRLDELAQHAETTRNRSQMAQSQLEALHERGDALEGRAAAVEGRAFALEGRVAPLENRMAPLEGRLAPLENRMAPLEGRLAPLENRMAPLEGRLAPLENRMAPLEASTALLRDRHEANTSEMIELRHYVHAANHWIVSMQASLADLEEAAATEREQADTLAALVDAGASTERTSRHADWAAKLGPVLPAAARVLDLGSGDGDWLAAMAVHGVNANGIEPNQVLAARARARDMQVASGDPLTTLSRCKDADLDAITLAAHLLAGDDVLITSTLAQILRALKPAGRVMLRVETPSQDDSPSAPSRVVPDAKRWAALLAAAGFTHAQVLPAHGAAAVLAQRAAP